MLPCSGRQNSAVPCLGCRLLFGMSPPAPLRPWRSLAEPPPPGQDFCADLTTPWQHPSSLGRDAHPAGAPRGASRARFSPPHRVSPALCPRDTVSPLPATLAPCLQLLRLRGLPSGTRESHCPGVSSFPALSPAASLPTALKHHGQRFFSLASTWDGAQGGRYFALAKAFGQAGPGRCAGKQGLPGPRVVPTAAQESLSRLQCAGRVLLSLTHPAWAHGAAPGHCCSVYPRRCLSQHPNSSSAPRCSPRLPLRRCQVAAGHLWPWEPRLGRHLHDLVDPTLLPGRAESGSSRGQEQG